MCTLVEKLVSEEEGIVSTLEQSGDCFAKGIADTLEELTEESVFEKGCENTLDWGEN